MSAIQHCSAHGPCRQSSCTLLQHTSCLTRLLYSLVRAVQHPSSPASSAIESQLQHQWYSDTCPRMACTDCKSAVYWRVGCVGVAYNKGSTKTALQKQRLLSACTQLNPLKLCLTELEETEQTQIVLTLGPLSQNLYMYITHSITLRKLLNKPTPILATLPGHLCFSSKWISITSASKYLAKKNVVSGGISFAPGHRPSAVS